RGGRDSPPPPRPPPPRPGPSGRCLTPPQYSPGPPPPGRVSPMRLAEQPPRLRRTGPGQDEGAAPAGSRRVRGLDVDPRLRELFRHPSDRPRLIAKSYHEGRLLVGAQLRRTERPLGSSRIAHDDPELAAAAP